MSAVVAETKSLNHQWASYYARLGWRVFPIKQGMKAPRKGELGITSATTDPATIDAWWSAEPDANIGALGLLRVDVDQKHGGMTAWETLQAKHGAVTTRTVRTPSGGMHLYFEAERLFGNSEGALPDGINIRGQDTGYCVMPPSFTTHIEGKQCEGHYQWIDVNAPIAPLPQWVADLIGAPPVCEATNTSALIEASPMQVADIRSALLSPGMLADWSYQKWASNGLALLSLGDVGRELFCEYSDAQLEKLGRTAEETAELWWHKNSHTRPNSDFRSIFKRAANLGWTNPNPGGCPDPASVGFGSGPQPAGMLPVPPPPPITATATGPVAPANEWPEPVNFFAGKMEAPSFDGSELPPELAAYPLLHARQTGFDPSMGVNAAVAIAAAAIPDYIQVCADSESNYFAQARLWHLTIAGPGAGKSPVQRELLKPLWELHAELLREWQKEMEDYERQKKEDPSLPKPPQPRVIVADVTLEKLSDVLEENPRGVLLATDEFSAWLGSLDQYKSGGTPGRDRGEWLRLFDGGPHQIERVTRGSKFVPNWGASILTATTPSQMQKFSRDLPEDGLIQRFLVAMARRKKRQDKPAPAHVRAACAAYTQLVRRLWNLRSLMHGGVVQLAPDTKERFDAWNDENDVLTAAFGDVEPALAGHVAKYPTFALRIALTFHCVRIVAAHTNAPDPAAYPLGLSDLELALAFLRRSVQHARAMYLDREGASNAITLARDIAHYILVRTTESALQRREMTQNVMAFRKADEGVQAAALRLVTDFGWVRPIDDGTYRKPHPTRFEVNPAVAPKFAALAEDERARRALIAQRLAELKGE